MYCSLPNAVFIRKESYDISFLVTLLFHAKILIVHIKIPYVINLNIALLQSLKYTLVYS